MPAQSKPEFLSVSELTKNLKYIIESNILLNNIWIKGEIYNLTYHSSGHIYFTLKDEGAVISAVFFKFANKKLKFRLKEGMSILALGSITVFEKRGSYQINISAVQPDGTGELQQRIEELKKKLSAEGIFDESHKKKIPFLPKRIGLVTSPTGAALQDIVKVALRRYNNIEIIIAPAKVQGDGAAETIARGIEELNRKKYKIDVIIAGRGGGSFEDLFAFNEEIVVRAFYNSEVPIISAVGHQIDHPLSDHAADVFAPTPSAAAEIAVPQKSDLLNELNYLYSRIEGTLKNRTDTYRTKIENLMNKKIFMNPFELINFKEMILGDLESRLTMRMKETLSQKRQSFMMIPDINKSVRSILTSKEHSYNLKVQALQNLSPLGIMKRGYSIASDSAGKVIKSVEDIDIDETFDIRLSDGKIKATVNSKIME